MQFEDRLAPAFVDLGGLRFDAPTDPAFALAGGTAATTEPVQVGFAPTGAGPFQPLLLLTTGATLTSTGIPTAQTPAASEVHTTGASPITLFQGALTLPLGALTSSGVANLSGGRPFDVDLGATFTPSLLALSDGGTPSPSDDVVRMQGALGLSALSGFSVPVSGSNAVAVPVGGGPTLTLAGGTVSVPFTAGGLTFQPNSTTSLAVGYSDGAFTVSGQTSFGTTGGDLANVTLDLTALTVQNGSLQSVSGQLTGGFSLAGMSFTGNAGLIYQAGATPSYGVFGTIGATFHNGTDGFTVDLGDKTAPGLTISGGSVQQVTAGLTGKFAEAGLTVQTDGLTLGYAAAAGATPARFTASGSASISFVASGSAQPIAATIDLGSTSDPGLVVQGGSLTEFNGTLTGSLSAAGVSIDLIGLALDYTAAGKATAARYAASGQVTIAFTAAETGAAPGGATLALGSGGTAGLVIQDGGLADLDGTLTGGFTAAGLTLTSTSLTVDYDGTAGTVGIAGQGSAGFAAGGATANATLDLGPPATPGLLIVNGSLSQLHASVSGQFTAAGLTVTANSLTLDYAAANGPTPARFQGSGGVTIAFSANGAPNDTSLSLQLGAGTTPGLVIDGGTLTEFDGTLSGNFTAYGLSVAISDLTLDYSSQQSLVSVSGTVSIKWNEARSGFTVSAGYTDASNTKLPGFVIQSGTVTQANFRIAADFSMLGLTVSTKNNPITFSYDRSEARYEASGTVAVSTASQSASGAASQVFKGISVTLNDPSGGPGLVVKDGALVSFYARVTAGFNLLGLDVEVDDFGIGYNSATHVLELTGGLKVTDLFSASVDLTGAGIIIDTATGAVDIGGITIELSNVNLGAFTINDFQVAYSQATPTADVNFSVTIDLSFPGGFEVDGSISFVNGEIDDISLAYKVTEGEGIAVGDTGLFITSVAGTVDNIENPAQLVVSGSLGVTYGPSISAFGTTASLLTATGTITADADELVLSADVKLMDGALGTGTGKVTLDWAAGRYEVDAHMSIYDGTFVVDFEALLTSNLDLFVLGEASLSIPDAVPIIGGMSVASGGFYFQYEPGGTKADDVIAGWLTVKPFGTVGFQYDFDGSLSVIHGKQVEQFKTDFGQGTAADGAPTFTYTSSQEVTAATHPTYITLTASWDQWAPSAFATITLPDGTRITQNQFTQGQYAGLIRIVNVSPNGISVIFGAGSDANLPTGSYQLSITSQTQLTSTSGTGTATGPAFSAWTGVIAPSVSVTGAAPRPDGSLVITYSTNTADAVVGATIDLYYVLADADITTSGVLIATGLPVASGPGSGTHTWTGFGGLRSEQYYLFAVIRDGLHTPVRSAQAFGPLVPSPKVFGRVARQSGPMIDPWLAGWVVFADLNGNGKYDPPTDKGVVIDPVAVTGADGKYAFPDLPAGKYLIAVTPPTGYRVTDPLTKLADGSVVAGQYVTVGGGPQGVFFQVRQSSSILGTAFNDLDGDGQQDHNEPGVPGITVFIDRNGNGSPDADEPKTKTDGGGNYAFVDLANGPYRVAVVVPFAAQPTNSTVGTQSIAGPEQLMPGPDFGLRLPGTVEGFAFIDLGGGPGYDPAVDKALPGVKVTLLDAAGHPIQTVLTDARGRYTFANVLPGQYQVRQDAPAGYHTTTALVGPNSFRPGQVLGSTLPSSWGGAPPAVDLDADGKLDLAFLSYAPDGRLTGFLFYGQGDGTFDQQLSNYGNVPGMTNSGVFYTEVADFDNNGLPDVAFFDNNFLTIAFQDRPREFRSHYTQQVLVGTGSAELLGVGVGDFNGDGWPDLVTIGDNGTGSLRGPVIQLLLNNFQAYSTRPAQAPTGFTAQLYSKIGELPEFENSDGAAVLVGDFYGQGQDDLALLTYGADGGGPISLAVLGGYQAGTGFTVVSKFATTYTAPVNETVAAAVRAAAADIDGDGTLDIVLAGPGPQPNTLVLNIYLNRGFSAQSLPDQDGTPRTVTIPGAYGDEMDLNVGDFNGDGLPDIVVIGANNGCFVVLNQGLGEFATSATPVTTNPDLYAVASGDFNGDGLSDLILGAFQPRQDGAIFSQMYLNVSPVGVSEPLTLPSGGTVVADFSNAPDGARTGSISGLVYLQYLDASGTPVTIGRGLTLYLDLNGDGRFSPGEPTAVTDRTGRYDFGDLAAGTYRVAFVPGQLPAALTDALNGIPNQVRVFPGADVPLTFVVTLPPDRDEPAPQTPLGFPLQLPSEGADFGLAATGTFDFPAVAATVTIGGETRLRVYHAGTGELRKEFTPYPGFGGAVSVALGGDFNGDGYGDLVVAPGLGGGPHVKIYDGKTLSELASFMAYDPAFRGGVYLAVGDVDGDGDPDIVTGAGVGGGPHVRVFDGRTLTELFSFMAYESDFRGGMTVAVGDVNGDGRPDIVTGTGVGGGPVVSVFDGRDHVEVGRYLTFEASFRGGVMVAAGDFDGDGKADLVAAPGEGGGPRVRVFRAADEATLADRFAFDPESRGGVKVSAADLTGDGRAELVVANQGPGEVLADLFDEFAPVVVG